MQHFHLSQTNHWLIKFHIHENLYRTPLFWLSNYSYNIKCTDFLFCVRQKSYLYTYCFDIKVWSYSFHIEYFRIENSTQELFWVFSSTVFTCLIKSSQHLLPSVWRTKEIHFVHDTTTIVLKSGTLRFLLVQMFETCDDLSLLLCLAKWSGEPVY